MHQTLVLTTYLLDMQQLKKEKIVQKLRNELLYVTKNVKTLLSNEIDE